MCGHKPKRRNEQSTQNEIKLLETNECTNRFCMYVVSALVCLQHDEGTVEIEDNLHSEYIHVHPFMSCGADISSAAKNSQ